MPEISYAESLFLLFVWLGLGAFFLMLAAILADHFESRLRRRKEDKQ